MRFWRFCSIRVAFVSAVGYTMDSCNVQACGKAPPEY
jgi:hypothetical protein